MGDLGLVPWLISFAVFFVFPFWRILDRVGFKPVFSLLALIPGGVLILLWVIALAKWPASPQVKKNEVPPDPPDPPALPGPGQVP
ncbi:MAG TPA: hypothetical protein VHB01_08835 [Nitrosospira sp.]|nr:hypothetical protein [Nitrosospira sp.]